MPVEHRLTTSGHGDDPVDWFSIPNTRVRRSVKEVHFHGPDAGVMD